MITDIKDVSFSRPGRNVGSFHSQCDTVGGDERQDDKVKPSLRCKIRTGHPECRVWWPYVQRICFSLCKKFLELLSNSFLLFGRIIIICTSKIVVCKLFHNTSLAFLLVFLGIILNTFNRRDSLTI